MSVRKKRYECAVFLIRVTDFYGNVFLQGFFIYCINGVGKYVRQGNFFLPQRDQRGFKTGNAD